MPIKESEEISVIQSDKIVLTVPENSKKSSSEIIIQSLPINTSKLQTPTPSKYLKNLTTLNPRETPSELIQDQFIVRNSGKKTKKYIKSKSYADDSRLSVNSGSEENSNICDKRNARSVRMLIKLIETF